MAPTKPGDISTPRGGFHKGSWEPPSRERVIRIENVLRLDRDVVARSVVERVVNGLEFPRSAPMFDGMRHYPTQDTGFATV